MTGESIRSLLALDGVDFSKHSGVMSYFQKNYVKAGIFKKEYSRILTEAFEIRSESDYDDYYMIAKEDVEKQIENAQFFLNGIMQYVENLKNNTRKLKLHTEKQKLSIIGGGCTICHVYSVVRETGKIVDDAYLITGNSRHFPQRECIHNHS